jgi:hypothetical protein
MIGEAGVAGNLRSVLPYALWLVLYALWGTFFHLEQQVILPEIIRMLFRQMLILAAVAVAMRNLRDAAWVAGMIQITVWVNAALCLWEVIDPDVLTRLVYFANPDDPEYSDQRPAGLWYNPNEAAFAFLFAYLLSYFARGRLLPLATRVLAVIGIFCTASRSGTYLWITCASVVFIGDMVLRGFRRKHGMIVAAVGVAAALFAVAVVDQAFSVERSVSQSYQLSRLLDATEEENKESGQGTRLELTRTAIAAAFEAPWHGHGAFTFQGWTHPRLPSVLYTGAHDIYVALLGETGYLGVLSYLLLMAFGVRSSVRANLPGFQRVVLVLLWLIYLFIGFVWHNQFTTFMGLVYAGLLWRLPGLSSEPLDRPHPRPLAQQDYIIRGI